MEVLENEFWLLIDTNIFLHFKPLDQIDWHELTDRRDQRLRLLVSGTVLSELDQKKWDSPSSKLRERAKKAIRFIEDRTYESSVELRKNLFFEVPPHSCLEASLFDQHGLNAQSKDDQILATLLKLGSTGKEIALVSADSGMRLRARRLGFRVFEPKEDDQLPPPEAENEQEIRKLKSKLHALENRLPAFALTSNADAKSGFVLHRFDRDEFSARWQRLHAKYPRLEDRAAVPLPGWNLGDLNGLLGPSAEQRHKYNEELEKFFEKYGLYLNELNSYEERRSRCLNLELFLENSGTAPANDVRVHLHFPDGFELHDASDFPDPPDEPNPPRVPRSFLSSLSENALGGERLSDLLALSHPVVRSHRMEPPNVSRAEITKTNSYDVSVRVRKVQHGVPESVGCFVVEFGSFHVARSFEITGTIYCDELNEPVSIALPLNITLA